MNEMHSRALHPGWPRLGVLVSHLRLEEKLILQAARAKGYDVTPLFDRSLVIDLSARTAEDAGIHVDEHDRSPSIFKFGADDSLRVEPEAVAIKRERAVQIGDPDRNHIDAGLHGGRTLLVSSYESESGDNTWRRDPVSIAHVQRLASERVAVLKISAI